MPQPAATMPEVPTMPSVMAFCPSPLRFWAYSIIF